MSLMTKTCNDSIFGTEIDLDWSQDVDWYNEALNDSLATSSNRMQIRVM